MTLATTSPCLAVASLNEYMVLRVWSYTQESMSDWFIGYGPSYGKTGVRETSTRAKNAKDVIHGFVFILSTPPLH